VLTKSFSFIGRGRVVAAAILLTAATAFATTTPQPLPFEQKWTTITQITANDDWSGVPGIVGYLGSDVGVGSTTNVDAQTVTTAATVVDVIANQTNPNITNGGVAEFHLTDPTIALQGSGTAGAPNIVVYLDTTGQTNIAITYSIRDIDATTDNAVQQVALQYRVGNTGAFINIPSAYVADATTLGATLVTPVCAILPAAAENKPEVQVRIITTNAGGNDEWVGIDEIKATPNATPCPTKPTGVATAT
jgi:hypothetical protein